MNRSRIFLSCCVFFLSVVLFAQEEQGPESSAPMTVDDIREAFGIERGPETGEMSGVAHIRVPEGYQFTGPEGTGKILQAMGNLTDGAEIGFISPSDYFDSEGDSWFVVFEYAEVGYVKDEEKDSLDADAILQSVKEGEPRSNAQREKMGLATLHVQKFAIQPRYNDQTHNLEWAFEFESRPEGHLIVNHNIKLLGREGYVAATLVCNPELLHSVLPEAQRIVEGFSFKEGLRYAEFRQGDKIAEYGLTGLMVGGGLALAAKSGLLGKLLKPILIGVVALGATVKRIFSGKGRA